MRFCRGALPRFTPAVCRMATNRTACGSLRSYSAGRERHLYVLEMFFDLPLWVHFGFVRFFMAISTGCRGCGGRRRENGADGVAFVRFCAGALALLCFPRGVRWGLRAPKPAPKSLRLSGLSSRCGGIALVRIRRAYTLLRSRIGLVSLSAGSTLGLNVEAAQRPSQTAPKSRMWKRHCRLSGLSSRCGGVMSVRIRAAVTRVHGKTCPALIYGRAGRAVLR